MSLAIKIKLYVGYPTTAKNKMNAKLKTIIDYLPNLFMYQPEPQRPIIAPTLDQAAIQTPYSMFNFPASIYTVTAAIFEYIIKYIPVADDTLGGTPIPIKYGLKMTPPPSPSAPATNPPPNPRYDTFLNI